MLIAVIGGFGVVAYYRSLQEVPFTHRRHSIWISPSYEISLGQTLFDNVSFAVGSVTLVKLTYGVEGGVLALVPLVALSLAWRDGVVPGATLVLFPAHLFSFSATAIY